MTDAEKLRRIGRAWKKLNDQSSWRKHGKKGMAIIKALTVLEIHAPELCDLLDELPGSILDVVPKEKS